MSSETAISPKPVIAGSFDLRSAQRPLPLTASQEQQVRDIYYKRVRSYCAEEIRAFAQCATGRTFSIPFVCRTERLAMNTCMNAHATREEEDKAREDWFQTIPDRRAEQEEKERWKQEERRKHREWWGLDEQGRRREGQNRAGASPAASLAAAVNEGNR